MTDTGKVFMNGRSQAVRLPLDFRFKTKEVYIRRDEETGDVILSEKPEDWDAFFLLADSTKEAKDFLKDRKDEVAQKRELW
ncbi:type II toxin-antitoxin system VapB family antitoxin [bacterium]|nr:type II toxin-antitoxin system VapB family antitoxin [bacterium]